ncbi:MAG: type IX secretion system outer membrane channel protein PorV [Bacteroidota bacterium]
MIIRKIYTVAAAGLVSIFGATAQVNNASASQLDGRQNTITTAVPFLMITPDARAGAMGDVGVATPNDMNAIHWNTSKLAFMEKNGGVSISYTPWLRQLVPDVSLSYLSAYGKINEKSAIGGSLRYFSLGEINFTDNSGLSMGNFNPNELAVDLGYSQKLSDQFAVGIAFRYIYSNLAGGATNVAGIKAGQSFAGDITAYYQNTMKYKGYKFNYGYGAAITNIGAKVTYTTAQQENFIPINLRVGTYWQVEIDKYNSIALTVDLNKLLVPTPPKYKIGANGQIETDPITKEPIIESGKLNNVPVVQGMLQSFSDAPGGFSEELNEINISTGMEYWYDKQFALRAGYFHENQYKGNRKYLTMGAGLRYNVFGLDVAYLISFQQRNPLDNTLRFTLTFDLDAFKKQKDGGNDSKDNGVFEAPTN